MNRAITDQGGICRQLATLNGTSGINTARQPDGSAAVTVTLGGPDTPESTIELEYGEVTDYTLYVGPYRPDAQFPYTVLSRELHNVSRENDLFPNGEFQIHYPAGEDVFTVEFDTRLLFSRRRDSRPAGAVVADIEPLLDLQDGL